MYTLCVCTVRVVCMCVGVCVCKGQSSIYKRHRYKKDNNEIIYKDASLEKYANNIFKVNNEKLMDAFLSTRNNCIPHKIR